jgi:hypothetical protein
MLDEDTKKFIYEMVNRFAVTGGSGASPEPGALEVLADALSVGHWADGDGVGKSINNVAAAISDLANAVREFGGKS